MTLSASTLGCPRPVINGDILVKVSSSRHIWARIPGDSKTGLRNCHKLDRYVTNGFTIICLTTRDRPWLSSLLTQTKRTCSQAVSTSNWAKPKMIRATYRFLPRLCTCPVSQERALVSPTRWLIGQETFFLRGVLKNINKSLSCPLSRSSLISAWIKWSAATNQLKPDSRNQSLTCCYLTNRTLLIPSRVASNK